MYEPEGIMNAKQNPPKGEVGEVDTRSPFHSVKDALNLFEEVTFSGEKSSTKKEKSYFGERMTASETQLHLTLEEVEMLKEKVRTTETATKKALEVLKNRKKTADDLSQKLNAVNIRKELAARNVESGFSTLKRLEHDLVPLPMPNSWPLPLHDIEISRENHTILITELDTAKLELLNLSKHLHTCVEEKAVFLREVEDAEMTTKSNTEKSLLLSLEISSLSTRPETSPGDEALRKLAEQNELASATVERLKQEMEEMKEEHAKLREKEEEAEQMAIRLNSILNKTEHDLKLCSDDLERARGARDELLITVGQVSAEAAKSRAGAEETRRRAGELAEEMESTRGVLGEAERRLDASMGRLEEAKAAEARALTEMRRVEAGRRDSGGSVVMSAREYDALKWRAETGWASVRDMKAESGAAETEVRAACERRREKVVEGMREEVRGMREEMKVAVQRAEAAEAAKRVIEGELRRWREREERRAAEDLAARPAVDEAVRPAVEVGDEREVVAQVVDRGERASGKALFNSLSGIFHRNRKQGR